VRIFRIGPGSGELADLYAAIIDESVSEFRRLNRAIAKRLR
jgi:hypothetical protein